VTKQSILPAVSWRLLIPRLHRAEDDTKVVGSSGGQGKKEKEEEKEVTSFASHPSFLDFCFVFTLHFTLVLIVRILRSTCPHVPFL
jgi:hypothetical protein